MKKLAVATLGVAILAANALLAADQGKSTTVKPAMPAAEAKVAPTTTPAPTTAPASEPMAKKGKKHAHKKRHHEREEKGEHGSGQPN